MTSPTDIAATIPPHIASRQVHLTLADSELDNTTRVAGPCTWASFASLEHHRREDKFDAQGRKTGFSPAMFRPGACTCGEPPRAATGALPSKVGCPDHPANAERFGQGPHGHRIALNAELVTLIGIDLDKNPDGTELTPDNAGLYVQRLRACGLAMVIWSSHSFDPTATPPKCNLRVFILPSRDVRPDEYKRLYGPLLDMIGVPSGIGRHPDPRRFWLFPSARPGAPIVHEVVGTGVLDVDALLAHLPPGASRTQAPGRIIEAEPPTDEAQQKAIEILAKAWPPVGTRSAARGELAGALAWSGWDELDIVRFMDGVTAATSGGIVTADVHANNCRWASASVSKIETGAVSGWPALAARLGEDVVGNAKRALGLPTQMTDDEAAEVDGAIEEIFAATLATEAVIRQEHAKRQIAINASRPAPLAVELDAHVKAVQKGLATRRDASSIRDAEYLRRINVGEFLTDQPDEDRTLALRNAAVALARASLPGTTSEQLQRKLLASAGPLAPDLPRVVEGAMFAAAQLPPLTPPAPRPPKDAQPELASTELGVDQSDAMRLETEGKRAGRPENNDQNNARIALRRLGVALTYDAFGDQEYMQRDEGLPIAIDDHVVKKLRNEMERRFDLKPPKDELFDIIEVVAREATFHPVLDYLSGLPAWDGTQRVDEWLIRAGAPDTAYVRAVSRLVLVAAVRRIRKPGEKFDEMLVLEGPQGKRKSSALRALMPNDSLFTDAIEIGMSAKELIEQTSGKWIVEVPEMHKRGADSVIKAMLSRQDDSARMAYARKRSTQRRHFVIVGTTNESEYLYDRTGNRRYWPVLISEFDLDWIRSMRDQIWAEAAQLEAAGASIQLDPSLYAAAAIEQEKRRTQAPIEVLLREALDDVCGRISLRDVWALAGVDLIGRGKPSPAESQEINEVMRSLGWVSANVNFGTKHGRGFTKGSDEDERRQIVRVSGGVATTLPSSPSTPLNFAGLN